MNGEIKNTYLCITEDKVEDLIKEWHFTGLSLEDAETLTNGLISQNAKLKNKIEALEEEAKKHGARMSWCGRKIFGGQ